MENIDLIVHLYTLLAVGIPAALLTGVLCGAWATHKWWQGRITKWGG